MEGAWCNLAEPRVSGIASLTFRFIVNISSSPAEALIATPHYNGGGGGGSRTHLTQIIQSCVSSKAGSMVRYGSKLQYDIFSQVRYSSKVRYFFRILSNLFPTNLIIEHRPLRYVRNQDLYRFRRVSMKYSKLYRVLHIVNLC